MKLNKRNCPINIELDAIGADMLDISMDICGKHYDFSASSVMGHQFGAFLYAIYGMYWEAPGERRYFKNSYPKIECDLRTKIIRAQIRWDSEGYITTIMLTRRFHDFSVPSPTEKDNIEITINQRDKYIVDARDLCYAVAKASTDAMKKYGFYGYNLTCGADCNGYGDSIDIERLLFIKAYALNAMEARETKELFKHPDYLDDDFNDATFSSFEKEIEILLFDM